ncbi:MAG: hypothetical protein PVSMB8_00770 [Vulcanimicrobiaceae bacterium]
MENQNGGSTRGDPSDSQEALTDPSGYVAAKRKNALMGQQALEEAEALCDEVKKSVPPPRR